MKFILSLCMNYMVHVSSIMWRIKKQPSNFTFCSDNALRLLVLVVGKLYWGLQVMSSFSNWGCGLKGYFGRGIFWRANRGPNRVWRALKTSILNIDNPLPKIKTTCDMRYEIEAIATFLVILGAHVNTSLIYLKWRFSRSVNGRIGPSQLCSRLERRTTTVIYAHIVHSRYKHVSI